MQAMAARMQANSMQPGMPNNLNALHMAQAQAQAQAQASNLSGVNLGQGMPPNMMGRMPNQNMPPGGPAANLSHDIFQSFLQRNPQQ